MCCNVLKHFAPQMSAVNKLLPQPLDRFNAAEGDGTAVNGWVVSLAFVDAGGDDDVILLHGTEH